MSHVAFIYSSGARYVEISKWTRKGNENKKNYLDFKFNYYVNDVNNYLKFVKVLEINMGYKYGVIPEITIMYSLHRMRIGRFTSLKLLEYKLWIDYFLVLNLELAWRICVVQLKIATKLQVKVNSTQQKIPILAIWWNRIDHDSILDFLMVNLCRAKQKMKLIAYFHRREEQFKVRHRLHLKLQPWTQKLWWQWPLEKLAAHCLESNLFCKRLCALAYKLDLPAVRVCKLSD